MISGAVYAAGNTSTCEHLLQSKCHYTRCPTKRVCSVAIRYILCYNKAGQSNSRSGCVCHQTRSQQASDNHSQQTRYSAKQAGEFTRGKADMQPASTSPCSCSHAHQRVCTQLTVSPFPCRRIYLWLEISIHDLLRMKILQRKQNIRSTEASLVLQQEVLFDQIMIEFPCHESAAEETWCGHDSLRTMQRPTSS